MTKDFTLLREGSNTQVVVDYVTAAKALNIPFQVEESLSPEAVSAYETDHILLCPDHYIAATGVEIAAMVALRGSVGLTP